MKRVILFFTLVLIDTIVVFGTVVNTNTERIPIKVVQPERENLSAVSCKLLHSKLTQMLTKNGIINDIPSNRFVLTAKANIINKDVIAGSPSRLSEKIELILIVGDAIENIKYNSYTIHLIGIGQNEDLAIQKAIASLRIEDSQFSAFIKKARERIVNYYLDNGPSILLESDILAKRGKWDEAIYQLSLIPNGCGSLYYNCQEKILELYQNKIDEEGSHLFSEAKAVWAKNPNLEGATGVLPIISMINPKSSCFSQVDSFLKEITNKLIEDEKRDWEFKMKQYEDAQAKELRDFQERKERDEREAAYRQQELSAAREVALEFARNQPDVVYQPILLW